MGVVRAAGLIFIMTILVGGCILANSSSPPDQASNQEAVEVSWSEAVEIIQAGEVRSLAHVDQRLILDLEDGKKVTVTIPSEEIFQEALARCGAICDTLEWLNL